MRACDPDFPSVQPNPLVVVAAAVVHPVVPAAVDFYRFNFHLPPRSHLPGVFFCNFIMLRQIFLEQSLILHVPFSHYSNTPIISILL